MSVVSAFKNLLVPSGRAYRTILFGLAKGVRMQLDLRNQLQRYLGFDERELFAPLRRLMPQCRSMVDIGANDGYYTLIFLRSGAARVVTCEPSAAADRLLENARTNGFELGERFHLVRNLVGLGEGITSVTELVRNLPGPILVKLDIEGAELDALESCEACDRLLDLRWVVETHSAKLETECIAWFSAHGFTSEIIPNASWRWLLPEKREVSHNRWLVAVPKSAA